MVSITAANWQLLFLHGGSGENMRTVPLKTKVFLYALGASSSSTYRKLMVR